MSISRTFRVFVLKNDQLSKDSVNLVDILKNKLNNTNVGDRMRQVKDAPDCKDFDLLSTYATPKNPQPSNDYIYGVIMRLRPAKEFKTLPSDFKNLYQFDEKGLLELKDSNDKVICSSFYHFMIKGKYLITDLSMLQTISPFTSYINKIIPETPCDFVPLILNDELNLSEVSMVTFKDQLQSVIDEDENSNISLKNMASSLLKLVCPTVDTLDELIEDKMITAAMTIQLKRPKRMTTEDYSHKLSAILAPIQDLKDVYIKLSNGKKIEGSQLVYTRKCELEDGEPNTYIKEMRNLLEQIEHK